MTKVTDTILDISDELRDALRKFYDEEIKYHTKQVARLQRAAAKLTSSNDENK